MLNLKRLIVPFQCNYKEIVVVSTLERQQRWGLLMEELNQIAKKTEGFPGLAERMALLAQGYFLVEPMLAANGPGLNIFHRSILGIPYHHLKILPWFSGDEAILRMIYPALTQPVGAYHSNLHTAVFSMESDNPVAMATVGLHELGHTLVAIRQGLAGKARMVNSEEDAIEELAMRTFDSELMLLIGGHTYKARFEHYTDLIMRTRREKRIGMDGFDWCNSIKSGMGRVFDEAWGPPPHSRAEEIRGEKCQIYCQMAAADRMFSKEQAKAFKVGFFKYHRANA